MPATQDLAGSECDAPSVRLGRSYFGPPQTEKQWSVVALGRHLYPLRTGARHRFRLSA